MDVHPPARRDSGRDSLWRPVSPPAQDRHAIQLSTFLDPLEGKADVAVSLSDIRPTYDLLTSLYKAAATGHAIDRASVSPGDPFYQHFAGTSSPSSDQFSPWFANFPAKRSQKQNVSSIGMTEKKQEEPSL